MSYTNRGEPVQQTLLRRGTGQVVVSRDAIEMNILQKQFIHSIRYPSVPALQSQALPTLHTRSSKAISHSPQDTACHGNRPTIKYQTNKHNDPLLHALLIQHPLPWQFPPRHISIIRQFPPLPINVIRHLRPRRLIPLRIKRR
jgi:hypothetical protein